VGWVDCVCVFVSVHARECVFMLGHGRANFWASYSSVYAIYKCYLSLERVTHYPIPPPPQPIPKTCDKTTTTAAAAHTLDKFGFCRATAVVVSLPYQDLAPL